MGKGRLGDIMAENQCEREFAKAAGVPRRAVADLRDALKEGEDWFKEGRRVYWSKKGRLNALAALGLKKTEAARSLVAEGEDASPAPDDGPSDAIVAIRPRNTRVLVAVLEKTGERVTVRVRNSAKFPLQWRIPVRPVEGLNIWELARKEPRWYGRW